MVTLVAGALCASLVAAQGTQRPALPRGADTSDWQAYFDYGADIIQRNWPRADTLFAWASLLDPSRPEPLFGRWVTFQMMDVRRYQRYLKEDPRVLRLPAVAHADSLFLQALERNPFVPQTLRILPSNLMEGSWGMDDVTQGWLAYARLDYGLAASFFAHAVRSSPTKYAWVRYYRALTFVPREMFDSATLEMTALLETWRARQEATPTHSYESMERIYHAIGLLHVVQGHVDSARIFFGRAVEENLGFFPAQADLADLELLRGDISGAVRDYTQAAELAPAADQAWIQYRKGVGLVRMGRPAEAITALERVIALAPLWADPYRMLGIALAGTGDRTKAADALQTYLDRAPHRDGANISDAQRRLAAVKGASK